MKTACPLPYRHFSRKPLFMALAIVALEFAGPPSVCAQPGPSIPAAPTSGELTGTVANLATKALLAGALVEIENLGLSATTDPSGQFHFRQLPAGEHTLNVTYAGLDPDRRTVHVSPERPTTVDVGLKSTVYRLDTFYATAEREGNAAAITDQRNAESIRTTVAFDAYGNLFNNELGELVVRLPGVAGQIADEGIATRVSIRGADTGLNTVSIDGNKMVSTAPRSRQYTMNILPSSFFEKMEVTKALTPDMDADSLGGNINLSTRTAVKLTEKRAQEFEMTAKWAPDFYPFNPRTRERPLHGFGAYTYRERFDAPGGTKNLAVTFNLSYRENATDTFNTNVNYPAVSTSPVPLVATNIYEAYDNRKTLGTLLRVDYRLTPHLAAFATAIYNDQYEPSFQYFRFGSTNASTPATLNASGLPVGTGAVLPGYSARLTEVVPQTTSRLVLSSEGNRFRDIERIRTLGFVHEYGALKFDYNGMHAESNVAQKDDESGGIFTTTITGIGFRQERTADGMAWTQTAGPSILNLANYPTNLLAQKNNKRINGIDAITFNAEYTLDPKTKSFLKAGGRIRSESSAVVGGDKQWSYAGPDGVVGLNPATRSNDDDLTGFQFVGLKTRQGQGIPFVNVASIAADVKQHPDRWIEDRQWSWAQTFIGTSGVTEQVNSGYLMGGGTWRKRLRLVGGVRVEDTRVHAYGNVPAAPLATITQIPDPIARAEFNYKHPRRTDANYTHWFPSGLLTYSFTRNFITRFNWTTSIGRPTFGILVPMEAVNTAAQTVTVATPEIRPQLSRNLEWSLEYYFEPVGLLTVSFFEKSIRDFIARTTAGNVPAGPDNGFSGSYAGYTIIQDLNTGTATIRGWEANYQQQLTFLPGVWRGLALMANYTRLVPEGDFGNVGPRTTNLIPNFVPTTANAGLTFKWRRLTTRVLWNYTGKYLLTYSATAASLAYIDERRSVNASASYAVTPRTRLFCDMANVFNEPSRRYLYEPGRFNMINYSGTWINAGFKTQF